MNTITSVMHLDLGTSQFFLVNTRQITLLCFTNTHVHQSDQFRLEASNLWEKVLPDHVHIY